MHSARILIVDDESQLRKVVRVALAKQGYEVNEARSGEAALDLLRTEDFQMVILDRNMPGIGGLETCKRMRANSGVGIIMLTVRKSEEDRIEALDAGADDYITKPFSMPELLARIRANLRRIPTATRTEPSVVAFDKIKIDLSARLLSVDGNEVRLTPKQFDVLQYLASNPNTAIRHSTILASVWGPEYADDSEYLHVTINQLRKKLEADPSNPRYILTEPWFGYRFRIPAVEHQ
jgi:two-component system KDP operon response regulator KdpE